MGARTGRFRRSDRLLRPKEFQHVTRHGRRAAVRGFVVFAVVPAGPSVRFPRLGITVSRRVGNSVVRSQLKRRIREWFRQERGRLGEGIDLLVIGRPVARGLAWAEIVESLREAARLAGAERA